eukprot:g17492.t1
MCLAKRKGNKLLAPCADAGCEDNMALRRRWEAAMEERDALQIQVNNMEKEMMLAGESQVVPNVLGFAGAMSGSELAALTTMRASTFYDVLLLREDSGTAGTGPER